jgi:4-hydroxy-tetrahydrodipicolinate synthase
MIEKEKIHGLAVEGSTGEGHTLTTEELRTALEVITKKVNGRVPIIAGVTVDSIRAAIARAFMQ